MSRRHGSNANGGPFSEATVEQVWLKGKQEPYAGFGKDCCGASMRWPLYGQEVNWGWEIDHIKPVAQGGSDDLGNLQPMQWENNRHKSDTWPWSPTANTCKRTN